MQTSFNFSFNFLYRIFSLAASINERWCRLKLSYNNANVLISLAGFSKWFHCFMYFLICATISQADLLVEFSCQLLHTHNIDFDRVIVLLFSMFIKYFCYFTLKYLGYGLRRFSIYNYFSCGTNILKTVHLRGLFLLIDAG